MFQIPVRSDGCYAFGGSRFPGVVRSLALLAGFALHFAFAASSSLAAERTPFQKSKAMSCTTASCEAEILPTVTDEKKTFEVLSESCYISTEGTEPEIVFVEFSVEGGVEEASDYAIPVNMGSYLNDSKEYEITLANNQTFYYAKKDQRIQVRVGANLGKNGQSKWSFQCKIAGYEITSE